MKMTKSIGVLAAAGLSLTLVACSDDSGSSSAGGGAEGRGRYPGPPAGADAPECLRRAGPPWPAPPRSSCPMGFPSARTGPRPLLVILRLLSFWALSQG